MDWKHTSSPSLRAQDPWNPGRQHNSEESLWMSILVIDLLLVATVLIVCGLLFLDKDGSPTPGYLLKPFTKMFKGPPAGVGSLSLPDNPGPGAVSNEDPDL